MRNKHGLKVGKDKPKYECNAEDPECEAAFFSVKELTNHMKEKHDLKPWPCPKCGKRFGDKQNLQFHEMSHTGKKQYVCDICHLSYGNPR